jgi:acyl dehydratase
MPIDPAAAVGASLGTREFAWNESDVLLYHLALGACELRYVYERDLVVLPTFAMVVPTLGRSEPPVLKMPGVDVDLVSALHGRQELIVHKPLLPNGSVVAHSRIAEVHDKGPGKAAIIVTETVTEYFTSRISIFVRGKGGFGGSRGPSTKVDPPARAPDAVLLTPTRPDQALLYRLLGDRNPLHVDPEFAALAGFPQPILHGLCTYGAVGKAVVDSLLEGDPARILSYTARFAGVVYPGETLRTEVWSSPGKLVLTTTVDERDGAPALSDTTISHVDSL